jgi:cell division protein FtsQ
MKNKVIRISKIVIWCLLGVGLLVSLSFVKKEQKQQLCNSVDITIDPELDNFFVDREMVIDILSDKRGITALEGQEISQINIAEMENRLRLDPYIFKAEVFLSVGGELNVNVVQRRPLIRILKNDGGGFYIDNYGFKMPLSTKYTSRVVVATGNIPESLTQQDTLVMPVTKELYKLAAYLDANSFWKAQIGQVHVNMEGDMILIPVVGNHEIILGNTTDMEEKFDKLMVFYEQGLSKTGWNKYSSINLKFRNQVVCKKIPAEETVTAPVEGIAIH